VKYFDQSINYPGDLIADNPLPWGVLYEYVSSTFLQGFINYVKITKAYVMDRYQPWHADFPCQHTMKLRNPPGSFNWVEKTFKNKHELFQALIMKGATMHSKLDADFQDDVVILAQTNTPGNYYLFWFDRDCSDSMIGRFQTTDTHEQVVAEFDAYILGKKDTFLVGDAREIPLHYFQGWLG